VLLFSPAHVLSQLPRGIVSSIICLGHAFPSPHRRMIALQQVSKFVFGVSTRIRQTPAGYYQMLGRQQPHCSSVVWQTLEQLTRLKVPPLHRNLALLSTPWASNTVSASNSPPQTIALLLQCVCPTPRATLSSPPLFPTPPPPSPLPPPRPTYSRCLTLQSPLAPSTTAGSLMVAPLL
jgi:hypothetical protein